MACFHTWYDSPLGRLCLYSDGASLIGVEFEQSRHPGPATRMATERRADAPPFGSTRRWLDAYFAGEQPRPADMPVRLLGTPFQRRVWRRIASIPYGTTVTYGEIARAVGSAPRAVGGATGRNPLPLVIPCHRVVGADGSLVGFGGGMRRKAWLLGHEGCTMTRLSVPARGPAL